MPRTWLLSEGFAGLQSQGLGLAEAAGLEPESRVLAPRAPWRYVSARIWPRPLAAVSRAVSGALPGLALTVGGTGAAVGAALRRRGVSVVQVQHPRMDRQRFDLVLAARHDELTGPNVIVTRTALHRLTPERLREAAAIWAPRLSHLPRPLVAVLVGGSNGRFRLDVGVAAGLARALAAMMQRDRVGLALTPSRRTDPEALRTLDAALAPLGALVWDGSGENPYLGMLALADAIVVTADSVSMVSEAVATHAPVLLAPLPGRSRRIGVFVEGLLADGRVRPFEGQFQTWPTEPLNDTPLAAAEMRRRLGL